MNPDQLFTKADGTTLKKACETNYFAHKAWVRHLYFSDEEREWKDDDTVRHNLRIRILQRTEQAVYFYRKGIDNQPANNEELMEQYNAFIAKAQDPMPYRDEQGTPTSLTDHERNRLLTLNRRRQGLPINVSQPEQVSAAPTTPKGDEDPFSGNINLDEIPY